MALRRLAAPGGGAGRLGTVAVPAELWWALREPGPVLAGMSAPGRVDWGVLAAAGFGLVVDLVDDDVPYDPAPLGAVGVRLEELLGRPDGPTDPESERRAVDSAATAVVDAVADGRGVLVHCRGGRGRTGTVLGVALVRLGHRPEAVVDWLDRVQRARGRPGWPEHPWQADVVRSSAG